MTAGATTPTPTSFPDSNPSNLLGGPARLGICYGTDDTIGTCNYYAVSSPMGIVMDWTPWPQTSRSQPCVLSWTRRAASGAVSTFVDAHSQRTTLVGSTC